MKNYLTVKEINKLIWQKEFDIKRLEKSIRLFEQGDFENGLVELKKVKHWLEEDLVNFNKAFKEKLKKQP